MDHHVAHHQSADPATRPTLIQGEDLGIWQVLAVAQCDPSAPERVEAVATLTSFLTAQVSRWYPDRCDEAFLNGVWALVHGMATLAMQGKIFTQPGTHEPAGDPVLADHVRASWHALIAAHEQH